MIHLDYQSKDPIYLQIKNSVAELIMLGVYPPGTQLPSVRSLAGELGINPNTIQKAYQELETAGITCSVSGKGSFVSHAGNARIILQEKALRQLKEALSQAHLAGITKEQAEKSICEEYQEESV